MTEFWQFPVLFSAAFLAGFVDSIPGGGGLITVPLLLSLGLDPRARLGTNNIQASFGSARASWHYSLSDIVSLRECGIGFAMSFGAAGVGAVVVRRLDPNFLRRAIPVLLIGVALYFLFKPDVGRDE